MQFGHGNAHLAILERDEAVLVEKIETPRARESGDVDRKAYGCALHRAGEGAPCLSPRRGTRSYIKGPRASHDTMKNTITSPRRLKEAVGADTEVRLLAGR